MAAAQGVTITIKDELVSKPYVEMTIKLMHKFGVKVEADEGLTRLHIPGCQTYQSPGSVFVEGDASSASYFLAGATITGGTMRVRTDLPLRCQDLLPACTVGLYGTECCLPVHVHSVQS